MSFDKQKIDYTLYLCTDRGLMSCETIEQSVDEGIKGGCSVVQLREKDCTSREFYELALRVRKITGAYNVPLIINDRVDIAMLCGADGVHLGQSDMPCKEVRKLVGEDFLIGVSTATCEEAIKAEQDGADYLGVGAMFTTATKTDTRSVSIDTLKEIRRAVKIPFVIIGGLKIDNVSQFSDCGINGVAVVSAVISAPNISESARQMRTKLEEIVK